MTTDYDRLLEGAACVGLPPEWFDAVTHGTADFALAACRDCPVTDLCVEVLNPSKTYMDGVCGGRVWRNGLLVLADGREVGPRSKHQHEQLALEGTIHEVSAVHGG
jgi:WhiB family redox-sensing transcriptional regulator